MEHKYQNGDKVIVNLKNRGKVVGNVLQVNLLQNGNYLYTISLTVEDYPILLTGVPEIFLSQKLTHDRSL